MAVIEPISSLRPKNVKGADISSFLLFQFTLLALRTAGQQPRDRIAIAGKEEIEPIG
ncbi:hypothetical protein JCM19231_1632 [Vibrio ishigakensis]|uniref:Uncharacterized protein n=1 Tax=Vibrio ishigakensis TaxID=1481914 RepID=A0A0B8NTH1_9VIBR|nr:hypothetical protein JCM19231_1632 [Vibrio ishigakensis]